MTSPVAFMVELPSKRSVIKKMLKDINLGGYNGYTVTVNSSFALRANNFLIIWVDYSNSSAV
jgi:hypothetical protein